MFVCVFLLRLIIFNVSSLQPRTHHKRILAAATEAEAALKLPIQVVLIFTLFRKEKVEWLSHFFNFIRIIHLL